MTDELQRRMPKTDSGTKKGKLHQLLSDDVGHPALAQHLHAVITLMKASPDWNTFKLALHRFCSGQVLMLSGPLLEGHG
ncbi:hypothetical protein [Paracoccus sp. (in: a-proteobacteria)]|uniref:hypothetical protein n=1 Tax=Paracoccus sp. TaxID=267 RepID=UPI0035B2D5CA